MDRRDFIKLSAIAGTSATLARCGNPETQLIRFVPEEELVPGVATWKPSVCPLCRAGCGVIARVMEGQAEVVRDGRRGLIEMGLAKKLEGNPAHPISQGKLCVRGQAAIQIAYHPDRLTQPLRRTGERGSGSFEAIGWDEAIGELVSRLDALAEAGRQRDLAYVTAPRRGLRQALVRAFLSRFGAPPPVAFELFGEDVLRRACALSFGREQLPTFDLARCRYLVAFGADYLGTWNSPVAQNVGYGRMRQGRPGLRAKIVQVEPRMSPTGANADEWIPIRPGTEGALALGLAHVIMADGARAPEAAGRAGALVRGWSEGLPDYTPSEVERLTGMAAARVERIAREMVEHGPALALIGQAPLAHTNGLFQALAVNALNALLGSVEQPGGLFFTPQPDVAASVLPESRPTAPGRSLEQLSREILAAGSSPVQALLLDGPNPVFASPPGWRAREAILAVPFVASFGSFLDDTSVLADLILPDHAFLESWVEDQPESGALMAVASLAPPVMRPLHQTRATPDVLLEVAGRLARPLDPPLPWQQFEELLRAAFASLPGDVWAAAQEQGGWWGERAEEATAEDAAAPSPDVPTEPFGLVEAQLDGDASDYPFQLLPYSSQAFLDGSLAHLPWLQELPDPLTTAMWSSWVEVGTQAAERLGIGQGDVVEVTSAHGSLRAPAVVSPGLAPDVVAVPVGQGHGTFTRYASGRGANPVGLLAPVVEPHTGALAWAATRVRVTRVSDGNGELILFAGSLREHGGELEGR